MLVIISDTHLTAEPLGSMIELRDSPNSAPGHAGEGARPPGLAMPTCRSP